MSKNEIVFKIYDLGGEEYHERLLEYFRDAIFNDSNRTKKAYEQRMRPLNPLPDMGKYKVTIILEEITTTHFKAT